MEDSSAGGGLRQLFTASEKRLLFGLEFRDSALDRVDFSGADLRASEFYGISLSGADFSCADLRGASFIGCDLRGARLHGALLGHTRFDHSWLFEVRGLSEPMVEYVRRRGGLLWSC